jgi:hypothetical protein
MKCDSDLRKAKERRGTRKANIKYVFQLKLKRIIKNENISKL